MSFLVQTPVVVPVLDFANICEQIAVERLF